MKKKESFLIRIWDHISDPKLKLPLMITAICLMLVLAVLLLVPYIRTLSLRSARAGEPVVRDESVTTPVPEHTPSPLADPTEEPDAEPAEQALIQLRMTWNSVNRDLYIRVLDGNDVPVTGRAIRADISYPGGSTYCYESREDGSIFYLAGLEPGDYVVSLQPLEGFVLPEPIRCTVKAEAQYEPIANIEEVADVKDVSEVSQAEVPDETSSAPEEAVPEVIVLPEEEKDQASIAPDGTEEIRVAYRFVLGPNGYLLYRGTDVESNVFPVDEDGDGIPEYGMYLVEIEAPEPTEDPGDNDIIIDEPSEPVTPTDAPLPQSYYVSVVLYQDDGKPVDTYEYEEIPLDEVEEKKIGWQVIDGVECFVYEDGSRAVGLKKIGGKIYYFNQYGAKASSVGIDVSFYNEDINWQAVKALGIDFVIIRVGGRGWATGVLYGDTRTQEYLRGARAAGLKIGVYFYSTAVNPYEAVEEASVALSTIGGISLDFPIFIDMEYSGDYPDGRADQLTASQRTEIAIAFCETIRNSGYRAGIYASQNYYKSAINYGAISGYTIWLASYTRDNQLPNFSNRYDIWQFTDRGLIDGIDGEVDMNVIF